MLHNIVRTTRATQQHLKNAWAWPNRGSKCESLCLSSVVLYGRLGSRRPSGPACTLWGGVSNPRIRLPGMARGRGAEAAFAGTFAALRLELLDTVLSVAQTIGAILRYESTKQ